MSGRTLRILKHFLVIVNLLSLTVGLAIVGVAIYVATNATFLDTTEPLHLLYKARILLRAIQWIMCSCGCCIIALSLGGLLGACKESRCLVIAYAVLLLLVLVANVTVIGLAGLLRHRGTLGDAANEIRSVVRHHYGNSSAQFGRLVTGVVDGVQHAGHCCGWNGRVNVSQNIFIDTPWYRQQNQLLDSRVFPDSCCGNRITKAENPVKYARCGRPTDEASERRQRVIRRGDCLEMINDISVSFADLITRSVACAILLQIVSFAIAVGLQKKIAEEMAV